MSRAIGAAFVLALAIVLVACSEGSYAPREIVSGEECRMCRMTIDRLQFAAQLVDGDGNHRSFDHPLCMVRFAASEELTAPGHRLNVRAYFVADLRSGAWLAAEDARYVIHESIRTVMDFGMVAADRSYARSMADSLVGESIDFDEFRTRFERTSGYGRIPSR